MILWELDRYQFRDILSEPRLPASNDGVIESEMLNKERGNVKRFFYTSPSLRDKQESRF